MRSDALMEAVIAGPRMSTLPPGDPHGLQHDGGALSSGSTFS